MRLLNVKTRQLEEFFEDRTPSYAILSHTWGEGEVSYQDLTSNPDYKQLAGHYKLDKCCEAALMSKLEYVWIDTCCIDKSSSAELTEAINSMFKWYAKSFRCFVYMADVDPLSSGDDADLPSAKWARNVQFGKSRWWTRGWTLQELLAPFELHFVASDWSRIAELRRYHKDQNVELDIRLQILHVTGIKIDEWQSAGVAQRLSWAAKRQTTRQEDMAYCLLGLLDVNMPLLYGEGEAAFPRLLAEVIKRFPGHDVLAAGFRLPIVELCPPDEETVYARPILPSTPEMFRGCTEGLQPRRVPVRHPAHYSLTNAGVYIGLPLVEIDPATGYVLALLDCCRTGSSRQVALVLAPDRDDLDDEVQTRFELAIGHPPVEVDFNLYKKASSRWIYIRNTPRKVRAEQYLKETTFDYKGIATYGFNLHSLYPVETLRVLSDLSVPSFVYAGAASHERRVLLFQNTDGRNIAVMKFTDRQGESMCLATITNAASAMEVLLQPWTWNRDERVPDEDLMRGLMQVCWDYDLVVKDQPDIPWESTIDFDRVFRRQGWLKSIQVRLRKTLYFYNKTKSGLADVAVKIMMNGNIILDVSNLRHTRDSAIIMNED